MSVPEVPEYLPEGARQLPRDPATWRAVAQLVADLLLDPRVPRHAKVAVLAGGLYIAPGVRRLLPRPPKAPLVEPLLLVAALRHLIAAAGYEVVRERWQGDDAGFAWLLMLTGIDA